MANKTKGQPNSVVETDSTSLTEGTFVVEKSSSVNTDGEATPLEFDPVILASSESWIEQGAKLEVDLLKHVISSASIMCAQGRMFGKAKKLLRAQIANDDAVEKAVEGLYGKFGLANSTMNRRIQMWDQAVDLEIIDEDLRHEIATSASVSKEILAKMEARIGSISGTQFMRQLGILPRLEDKPEKKAKTAKEKIEAKAMQMKALVKEMQDLIKSDEVREQIPNANFLKDYYKLIQDVDETIARFKKLDWLTEPLVPAKHPLGLADFSIPSIVNP